MTPRGDKQQACSERQKLKGILDEVIRRLKRRAITHSGMTANEVKALHEEIVERRRQ